MQSILVTIEATEGSVPREAGVWMAVFADNVMGTIGGGHVEFEAIATARQLLSQPDLAKVTSSTPLTKRYVLGPSLGQCCGGVMVLRYEVINYDINSKQFNEYAGYSHNLPIKQLLKPVALFGGGHVGKALIHILGTLPLQVDWIDSRDEIFPSELPDNVSCEHSDPVQAAVNDLPAGSRVLIMSFSHAEDLDVVAACLKRQREKADLTFIGLIGSKTKWATFRHRLEDRGFTEVELAQVTCPIGISGIVGKEPEVIAVAVAAQLLKK